MPRTEYHYWLYAVDTESGKPYLIYGCPAREGEDGARQVGMEMLGNLDFKIKRFPTRTLSTASSMLRGTRLKEGLGIRKSAKRQGHEKTLRRREARRQRLSPW